MALNYWAETLEARVGRRRLLAATATASLGAAFLAACGGSDSSSGGSSGDGSGGGKASGLLAQSVDSSKQAKRGGTFKFMRLNDVVNFDPDVEDTTGI